jgi:hypothetical protein
MPIAVKTPTGPIVTHVCFSREDVPRGTKFESCSPQSRRRLSFNGESLEFMSHEATEMRFAVSGTIWIRSSAESAVVV